jgi:hypothetical protein
MPSVLVFVFSVFDWHNMRVCLFEFLKSIFYEKIKIENLFDLDFFIYEKNRKQNTTIKKFQNHFV